MILKFRVYEQTISLQSTKSEPRQGSKDYLELQFSFSSDWNDLLKYVYLQHGEVSVPHDLVGESIIVDEYFTEQTEFNVTLLGKSADGSVEVPTNVVTVFIKESNNLWVEDAPEPQNSWLVQVVDARDKTLTYAIRAENAAQSAQQSATSAAESASAASTSETNAKASEESAKASQTAATESANTAANSAELASASASAASESASAAAASETVAKASEEAAKTSETAAKASETAAAGSASAAKESQDAAKLSETAAYNSEKSAKESAASASVSASEASASATAASESEMSAIEAKTAAETAKTEAGKSASAAKESETASKASETAAAGSASAAQQSATSAAESAAVYDDVVADVNQLKQDLSAEQTAREEADNALRADLTANANADAGTRRSLDALWKLNQGISYQFETDNADAYSKIVPSGAKLASVDAVGGKTVVWNQWVHPISSENVFAEANSKVSVSDGIVTMYPSGKGDYSSFLCRSNFRRKANTKYYLRYTAKSSAWSQNAPYAGFPTAQGLWVTSAAVDKSVTDWQTKRAIFGSASEGAGSSTFSFRKYAESSNAIVYVKDIVVINLTMLYGYGNEPSSLDDPRIAWIEQYATEHFEYNAGALVSADVESAKYNDTVVAEIPEAVRTLPGYGWSAGDVCNYIERTGGGWQYVQRVGSRPYQEGDIVTDGITTYYMLDTPVVTDITDLMNGILDAIPVEAGGTLTFDNAAKLPVPSSVEYAVKLSEVNG